MYRIINWYIKHFPFPKRGFKYFLRFAKKTGLYNKVYQKRLHNGLLINIHLHDHIQAQLFWYGYYEKKYIRTFEKFLSARVTVTDIGANVGYYSLAAAKVANKGTVHAFEPYSAAYQQLLANCALNGMSSVIQPVNKGIGMKRQQLSLYISQNDNIGMTGFSEATNFTGEVEEVEIISLDEWAEQQAITAIDVIKLDIEGYELQALKGMTRILQTMKPVLFIEIDKRLLHRFQQQPADVFSWLENLHYKPYRVVSEGVLALAAAAFEDELIVFMTDDNVLPQAVIRV